MHLYGGTQYPKNFDGRASQALPLGETSSGLTIAGRYYFSFPHLVEGISYGHSEMGREMDGVQAGLIEGYVLQGSSPQSGRVTAPHTHGTGYTDIAGYAKGSSLGTVDVGG